MFTTDPPSWRQSFSCQTRPQRIHSDSITCNRGDQVTHSGSDSICVRIDGWRRMNGEALWRLQLWGDSCFCVAGREQTVSWGRRPINKTWTEEDGGGGVPTGLTALIVSCRRVKLFCWITASCFSESTVEATLRPIRCFSAEDKITSTLQTKCPSFVPFDVSTQLCEEKGTETPSGHDFMCSGALCFTAVQHTAVCGRTDRLSWQSDRSSYWSPEGCVLRLILEALGDNKLY